MHLFPISPKQARDGRNWSVRMATLTLVTFALAMIAVPPCGPYCIENCLTYPYHDSMGQFPRDYIWIYLALFQLVAYLVWTVHLHRVAGEEHKTNALLALLFGTLSAGVLLLTYWVQPAVVPLSLLKEEYDGIALLTMYNEHGLFIAQEELGYLLMALSLFFFAPIFAQGPRHTLLKWLFRLPLPASVLAYLVLTLLHGFDRSYRFEVFVISADWLVLIVAGYVLPAWFSKIQTNSKTH
ncbi:MAG: hypothetical protein R2751_03280 [Bacteroidales bacterium]